MAPLLYCMAQAPCNPGHSALVMTSDSPGNHEGLATPLASPTSIDRMGYYLGPIMEFS